MKGLSLWNKTFSIKDLKIQTNSMYETLHLTVTSSFLHQSPEFRIVCFPCSSRGETWYWKEGNSCTEQDLKTISVLPEKISCCQTEQYAFSSQKTCVCYIMKNSLMSLNYCSIQLQPHCWWQWNKLWKAGRPVVKTVVYLVQWEDGTFIWISIKGNFKPGWVFCRFSFTTD